MVTVPTTRAQEDSLRPTRARINASARAACLTGVRGGHFDKLASGPGHLVAEHLGKPSPASIENAARETSVRLDHVADLELLENDDAVALGVAAREYVKEMFALPTHLAMQDG